MSETLRQSLDTYLGVRSDTQEEPALHSLVELGRETVRGDESQKELIGQQVPMGEGLLGRGAEVGETKIGLPTYKGIHQAGRDGVNADPQLILSTPIFIGDEMIGAITALRIGTDRDNFDGWDALFYVFLGALTAALIENWRIRSGRKDVPGKSREERHRLRYRREIAVHISRQAYADPDSLQNVNDLLKATAGFATPNKQSEA